MPDRVSETNDEATMVKAAIVSIGYIDDPFVASFSDSSGGGIRKKSPEIHRGYYVRMSVVWRVVCAFIARFGAHSQIVNLGCGFDTLYFRLKSSASLPAGARFVDVDLHSVIERKITTIARHAHFRQLIALSSEEMATQRRRSPSALDADDYHLFGGDLRDSETLLKSLADSVSEERPTLFLAECVLVYLSPQHSARLLQCVRDHFTLPIFLNYEPVNLSDRFGEIMLENLRQHGATLRGAECCQSKTTQQARFTGWARTTLVDMLDLYRSIPQEARRRIERLEMLDESFLMEQLFSHYCFVLAFKIDDCCPITLSLGDASVV